MDDTDHGLPWFNEQNTFADFQFAMLTSSVSHAKSTWPNQELAETEYADTWPAVVNSAAQLIRWTDQTWGAVANVLGGGTAINAGLYIEEEPDYFQDNFGEAPESTGIRVIWSGVSGAAGAAAFFALETLSFGRGIQSAVAFFCVGNGSLEQASEHTLW